MERSIVAVHGLSGHWKQTWLSETGRFWLKDYLPGQLQEAGINARIMSYGYNSSTAFSRSVTNIANEAGILLGALDAKRVSDLEKRRPILFIAHSLGGIIVKKVQIM